jgi:hypothetical protein
MFGLTSITSFTRIDKSRNPFQFLVRLQMIITSFIVALVGMRECNWDQFGGELYRKF